MSTQRVGIVGGGILGLAIGRRITELFPDTEVTVLEKEGALAQHQTGHNSGVVHAGLYYAPGSLKATLCRRGVDLLKEYTQEKGLPYEECGKLVIAVDDSERGALENIWNRASENGVPGIVKMDAAQLREVEPHAAGVAAIHSPFTAITDYVAVSQAYAEDIVKAGGTIHLNFPVDGINQTATGVEVSSGQQRLTFDRLVLCAGLQSDTVARWAGDDAGPAIVPFRGEYFRLTPEATGLCKGLIYPVPDPNYPFLGVHFTKRVGGAVDVGPNAVLAFAREGYTRGKIRPRELAQALAWPGFRKLAAKHWKMGIEEMAGSVSKRLYLKRAQAYVPEVKAADLVPAPAGVRAQALDRDGSLVDDFRISVLDRVTAVRNAPSPAATSSLAIAEYVTEQMRDQFVG
ncbi:L-2-hydroxyglutarate oxidase [Spongisporangium articulatum]|uniref:L-2-hydroxyglutarate oxidase n=1 Tax=Spongisporangium articulatum TaxID=3362603 RepID=A0ABW8AJB5_9ACTN